MENKKSFYGILLVVLIIVGACLFVYLAELPSEESKTDLEKECAKAGEEISPVEHRQGIKCCEGLVGIEIN